MSATQRYDNPETKQKLDAARQKLAAKEREARTEQAVDEAQTRETLASEPQPGRELPDLRETITEEFRGHEFEFAELGGDVIETMQQLQAGDDADDAGEAADVGLEIGDYVYDLLGEKATHADADRAYWEQYDLYRTDIDGVMNLVERLITKSVDVGEVDPEDVEAVEEFRNE